MALSITIQKAGVSDGHLEVTYAKNGDGGGYGISWPTANLDDYVLTEADLEQLFLRMLLTWARKRNVTAAQLVGKTFTVDFSRLANLVSVG